MAAEDREHHPKEVALTRPDKTWARERIYRALYERSYKRLKRRGLSEEAAARLATELAERTVERTQPPEYASGDKLTDTVHAVCDGLSQGKSYFELMRERPYLASGRIDRLVAAAGAVRPQVSQEVALAARRATSLERLSGCLAVGFMAVALAALGIWWSLGVGFFVAVGAEAYMQTWMPPAARRISARIHLSQWLGFIAVFAFVYVGYGWVNGRPHAVLTSFGLLVFMLFVAFIVPGLTLASLVGHRERAWRRDLEKKLLDEETGGPGD